MNEKEPTPPPGSPVVPDDLVPEAKAEWVRISHDLSVMGMLSLADYPALVAYCTTWARYQDLRRKYEETGPIIKTTNGNVIQNPLLGSLNVAERELRKWLTEFGLTHSSRSKIITADFDKKRGIGQFIG